MDSRLARHYGSLTHFGTGGSVRAHEPPVPHCRPACGDCRHAVACLVAGWLDAPFGWRSSVRHLHDGQLWASRRTASPSGKPIPDDSRHSHEECPCAASPHVVVPVLAARLSAPTLAGAESAAIPDRVRGFGPVAQLPAPFSPSSTLLRLNRPLLGTAHLLARSASFERIRLSMLQHKRAIPWRIRFRSFHILLFQCRSSAQTSAETVTVTATRAATVLTEVPESISVVTAKQIADTPGPGPG